MLCYVLICTVAFMFVCSWNTIFPISFQPIVPPFSGLQDVADFDVIIEPDSSHESDSNVIKVRESTDEDDEEEDIFIPSYERRVRCLNRKITNKAQCSESQVKNELGDIGTVFVNKFIEDEDEKGRYERDLKDVEEDSFLTPNDEENESKEKEEEGKGREFDEQEAKAINVTNTTKFMFEAIETPPVKSDQPENQCCEEEEEKKSLIKNGKKQMHKSFGKNDKLKMHFYKHLPHSGSTLGSHENKKSLVINLYPDRVEDKMKLHTPENYDYIALLSKGNKFVEVPAVKFTVVPAGETGRRRRSDSFTPFCISTYRPKPHFFTYKPNKHLFTIANKENNYPTWTHVPILFINTVPNLKKRSNKLSKRAANPELDNQYLREANLLIHNLNVSLRMGLTDSKNTVPAEAGILANSNQYPVTKTENFKSDDKKLTRREAIEESPASAKTRNDNFEALLSADFSLPSPNDRPLSGKGELLAKNEIHSLDISPSKNDLLKNRINSFENLPNKPVCSFGISSGKGREINSMENERNNLFKNEINPLIEDNFMKNELSSMDISQIEPKTLTKNEINPLEISSGEDTLAENEINSVELASDNKDDGLISDEFDPLETDSHVSGLIKNEVDPVEIAPSSGSSLTKYEIDPMEASCKDTSLIQNEIDPMEIVSYKDNTLIKNEIDPMEIVPYATGGATSEVKRGVEVRQNEYQSY